MKPKRSCNKEETCRVFNDGLLLQWPLSVDFGLIKFEL